MVQDGTEPITETHSPQMTTGLESNTQKIILKNNLVDTLALKGKHIFSYL